MSCPQSWALGAAINRVMPCPRSWVLALDTALVFCPPASAGPGLAPLPPAVPRLVACLLFLSVLPPAAPARAAGLLANLRARASCSVGALEAALGMYVHAAAGEWARRAYF